MTKDLVMSGGAAAVVIGVICIITPWFLPMHVGTQILITLLGAGLILLGIRN